MHPQYKTPEILKPKEIKAIYEINRVILRAEETNTALQEIIRLVRPVFIFDNIALYQIHDADKLDPTYARAIGRGRTVEDDLTWGDSIAKEVIECKDIVNRVEELPGPLEDPMRERLRLRYFLGLPLRTDGELLGALVFIRFGGPSFTPEQIDLAEFVSENITHLLERKRLVERIASLEAQRKLDQLQENFIATVSHDLRSPLGFIKGYATTLLREDTKWDSSIRREFLTIIDEEADRLGELIDNLLDSSRLQAGTLSIDLQQLRIDTLLRDIIQRAIAGTYKLNIIPQTNFPKVLINGDSRRLVQVFDNLFRNADKYASGSLIKISMDTTSERVLITFQDFGPGIPEEHLEDIFKRFYRLPHHSNAGRGSGLGLYICRKIIRAHGGEIYAKSKIGQGTAFFIDLPRIKNFDGYEENEK